MTEQIGLHASLRALIEHSLTQRTTGETLAFIQRYLSGQSVTYTQIQSIRGRMVARGVLARSKAVPIQRDPFSDDTRFQAFKDAQDGSARLLHRQIATGQYNGAARQAWLERHGVAA